MRDTFRTSSLILLILSVMLFAESGCPDHEQLHAKPIKEHLRAPDKKTTPIIVPVQGIKGVDEEDLVLVKKMLRDSINQRSDFAVQIRAFTGAESDSVAAAIKSIRSREIYSLLRCLGLPDNRIEMVTDSVHFYDSRTGWERVELHSMSFVPYWKPPRNWPGCDDDDGDGVHDTLDKCPRAMEDHDYIEDHDGCPDYDDRDQDGIYDSLDDCPDQSETYNLFEDEDGCPDTKPVNMVSVSYRERTIPSFKGGYISFDPHSYEFTSSFEELDRFIERLNSTYDIYIEITSSAYSDKEFEQDSIIAIQKGEEIRSYMIYHGVHPKRLRVTLDMDREIKTYNTEEKYWGHYNYVCLLMDSKDRCSSEAEDWDDFQDRDGCPDPDNDQDGFPDVIDDCPNLPDVTNAVFVDGDGCP